MKNISIGNAPSNGKCLIHSAGKHKRPNFSASQDALLESMAEAITVHCCKNILFINVANNLSVDCDCNSNQQGQKMADTGIFASLDPVAVEKACVDAVLLAIFK